MNKIILVLLVIGIVGYIALEANDKVIPEPISEACTMDAKLCPDGSYVGRTGPNCEFAKCPEVPNAPVAGKCYIGGCSGEICSDQPGVASTCQYMEAFACYKSATCKRQTTGECGWTQTEELKACISASIGEN